jgi:hypothetical protein
MLVFFAAPRGAIGLELEIVVPGFCSVYEKQFKFGPPILNVYIPFGNVVAGVRCCGMR